MDALCQERAHRQVSFHLSISVAGHEEENMTDHDDEPRESLWPPDMVSVLVVFLIITAILFLTFEIWAPHGWP
jgi:hypothetical protein